MNYRPPLLALFFATSTFAFGESASKTFNLGVPISSQKGTVQFVLNLEKEFASGIGSPTAKIPVMQFPDLSELVFQGGSQGYELLWTWTGTSQTYDRSQVFPVWPGPGEHYVQYSWRADHGIFDLFINGVAAQLPKASFQTPWRFRNQAISYLLFEGAVSASNIQVRSEYTPPEELLKELPAKFPQQGADHFPNLEVTKKPLDASQLKGSLVVNNTLGITGASVDWTMQGNGRVWEGNGWMNLAPKETGTTGNTEELMTYWMPKDLPSSFVAEWEQYPRNYPGNLSVVFAAEVPEGTDTRSYEISYYTNDVERPGEGYTTIRKNPGSVLVSMGDVALPPETEEVYQIQLVKSGKMIQLSINGKLFLRWDDDTASRYGEPIQEGRFGFRQSGAAQGRYKNLKIWEAKI